MKKRPARGLGKAGRALWAQVTDYHILPEGGELVLHRLAKIEDETEAMRAIVATEGPMLPDRFGQPKAHPLLTEIVKREALILRGIRQLGLDLEPLRGAPGRPPGSSSTRKPGAIKIKTGT